MQAVEVEAVDMHGHQDLVELVVVELVAVLTEHQIEAVALVVLQVEMAQAALAVRVLLL
jgi:hypothetical protein